MCLTGFILSIVASVLTGRVQTNQVFNKLTVFLLLFSWSDKQSYTLGKCIRITNFIFIEQFLSFRLFPVQKQKKKQKNKNKKITNKKKKPTLSLRDLRFGKVLNN